MSTHTVKGLLGQPVITIDSGKRVGSIQEILFDPERNRVTAIVLSKPPVAGNARAIPANDIRLFGTDVTLVASEHSIAPLTDESSPKEPTRASTQVIRTQVISTTGTRLGEVSDISLDQQGNILGYKLSHSIVRDALRGKQFIPVSAILAVGDDALLVAEESLTADSSSKSASEKEPTAREPSVPESEDRATCEANQSPRQQSDGAPDSDQDAP